MFMPRKSSQMLMFSKTRVILILIFGVFKENLWTLFVLHNNKGKEIQFFSSSSFFINLEE